MRHKSKFLFLLLWVAVVAIQPVAFAQEALQLDPTIAITQYPRQSWSGDNGLPQSTANAIAQTPDGYLWVGTQDGIARLDGVEIKSFDKFNQNILKTTVSSLFVSADGDLWIGTKAGGVTRYDGKQFNTPDVLLQIQDRGVNAIAGSSSGTIWFGTADQGLFRYRDGVLDQFNAENGLPAKNITALMMDRDGQLWIGSREQGYFVYDGSVFTNHGSAASNLSDATVRAIVQSKNGDVLLGTNRGLFRLRDGTSRGLAPVDGFPNADVISLLEDNAGTLWVGSKEDGLFRIVGPDISRLSTANGFETNEINAILQDREGNLWIGTGVGLTKIGPAKFLTYSTREGLSDNTVWPVYGDDNGTLWIGTDGGVNRLKDGKFTHITTKNGLTSNSIQSISGQRDGSIWIGTTDVGLSRYKDGVVSTFGEKDGLKADGIPLLYTDSRDRLWIGYFNGGLQWYEDGEFHWFAGSEDKSQNVVELSSDIVTVMMEGSLGDLWIGTYDGGLNRINNENKIESIYNLANGLLSNTILALYQDVVGIMWVGTRDGGLSRVEGESISAFTTEMGLHNNTVQHIVADGQGNLWMTSNQGLSRVNRNELNEFALGKRKSITSVAYDLSDGLLSNEFNGGVQPAGWKSTDGRLWFPSSRGLVSIDPANIPVNNVPPRVVVESVMADGVEVQPGQSLAPGVKRLEFKYAAPSFVATQRVRYEYKLEGSDDDWQQGNGRIASYTNIDPGTYQFLVRAENSDHVQSDEVASFTFSMRPFFYQTIWFILLCALGVALMAFTIYRLRVNRLKARQRELEGIVEERTRDLREEKEKTETALRATEIARRDAEQQKEITEQSKNVIEAQAEQLREMDRIKSRFFGNISHEFRTPLTLTIGPLENALTGVYGPVGQQLGSQLEVMLRNSRRLLRLINQLLDLSKLESGKFKLKPRKGELVNLVEGVVMSFTAFAEKEGINLGFKADSPQVELWYDSEAVEKVLYNLISNAVKFTPESGDIFVNVREARAIIRGASYDAVEIRVKDSGSGIPAADLPYIFDRFHQVDGTVSRVQEGTGIGLSLVKELVDLHGGTIRVESALGEGTEFVVILPMGTDHFDKNDLKEGDADDDFEISHGPMVEMAIFDDVDRFVQDAPGSVPDESSQTLLIVDDSRDIRDYVVSCLQSQYKIVTAKDGIDGLEKIKDAAPDLIISDVMMPRMDGYAFCRAIKKDPDFKHIPVILLTSKASLEAKLEGLEAGSDDYLAKPFNATELRVRIRNLLRLRHQTSELKGLNNELVETNDALRVASELKSQLLNIASHDMKNPLTAIREFARIIRDEVGQDSHLDELLELIYSSSNEMLQLVTQLLDSAALESGKLTLNMRPVSVSSLAEIVVHRNANQAKLKGQALGMKVVGNPETMVSADFDRLQEAMDNLVSNAIKYSPLENSIEITVRCTDSKVRFEVKDYGPGLSEDDMTKLFGKFVKLSAQPTGGESSTGLGLSIVKQIVELHHGEVTVESVLGEGSTFAIELASLSEDEVGAVEMVRG